MVIGLKGIMKHQKGSHLIQDQVTIYKGLQQKKVTIKTKYLEIAQI